jgi:trimeric autotransporter adhesin
MRYLKMKKKKNNYMKKQITGFYYKKTIVFLSCFFSLVTLFQAQTGLITFSVTQFSPPPTPTISPNGSTAICAGSSLVLSSSSSSGNLWSNGATTPSIVVSNAGSYSVTVSSNGCFSTSNPVTITTTSISISVTLNNPSCGNDNGSITASISGGTAPYNIQWSNGDFGPTADSLVAGQYVVQVTDAAGCFASQVINLNSSNGPSVLNQFQNNVTCNGGNNGVITVNAGGGTAPLSYLWSNGATTSSLFNLSAGVYDLVITDANGCVANASFNVTEPNPVSVSFTSVDPSCGSSTGSLTASVSGGNAPFTYSWSANAGSQTTATASNLSAGIYTVQLTYNSTCQYTAVGTLGTSSAGPLLNFNATASSGCGNASNGSIDMSISGGTLPYTINWSNGSATEDLSGLAPGTYSVVVIDGNGCASSGQAAVANGSGNNNPEICIVSVDTFTQTNKVVWEKPGSANGIKEYKIYREGSALNVYNHIATLPFDSLSEYTDPVANPAVRAWRYKISYVDSCGSETALSTNHKTIHLAVNNGLGGVKNLAWDDYEGFPFLTFNIWRYHTSTGWVKIDSLPSNLHSYTDLNPPAGGTLDYAVEVVKPVGCNSTRSLINTSRSNVKNIAAPLVGMEEHSLSYFHLYPNPTQTSFTIEVQANSKLNLQMKVMDFRGREVMNEQRVLHSGKNTESIDVAELASGIYFVELRMGQEVLRRKLIKE